MCTSSITSITSRVLPLPPYDALEHHLTRQTSWTAVNGGLLDLLSSHPNELGKSLLLVLTLDPAKPIHFLYRYGLQKAP